MKEREDSVKEIEPLLRPKLPVPTATPLVGSTRNPYIDVGTTLVRNGWKNALIASLLSRQFLLNAFYFTYSVGLYVLIHTPNLLSTIKPSSKLMNLLLQCLGM